MLKFRLTETEKEAFLELLTSEGYSTLVTKILPTLLEDRATRVITQNVDSQESLLILAMKRAEYEGSKKLAAEIADLKNLVKIRK